MLQFIKYCPLTFLLLLIIPDLIAQSAKEYFETGKKNIIEGNNRVGIANLDKAISVDPKKPEYYNIRGVAKSGLEDYTGAIKDYTSAININPSFIVAYKNRLHARSKINDYAGIIADCDKLIAYDPDNPDYWFQRAAAKRNLSDIKGSMEDYNKAKYIQDSLDYLTEPSASDYNKKGYQKYTNGDFVGAIKDFNKAIELCLDTTNIGPLQQFTNRIICADAFASRGNAKLGLSDYRGAIVDYTKAIELNVGEKSLHTYYNRGLAKMNLKDFAGALKDVDIAIRLTPDFADAYVLRGIIEVELEDFDKACLDWSKAGELGHSKAYDLIKKFCTQ